MAAWDSMLDDLRVEPGRAAELAGRDPASRLGLGDKTRIDDPAKNWKFRRADLEVRARWDEYHERYEEALTETSTEWSPWYVVPADRKWVRDVAVAALLVDVLETLDPRIPPPEAGLDGLIVG